jgi:ribosome biogenesis protein NSA1
MPRITSVESPGCPPLRAITTDILGLVKGTPAFPILAALHPPPRAAYRSFSVFCPPAVVEARARPAGVAKVVETWGEPDASRAILVASLADRAVDPVSHQRTSPSPTNPCWNCDCLLL